MLLFASSSSSTSLARKCGRCRRLPGGEQCSFVRMVGKPLAFSPTVLVVGPAFHDVAAIAIQSLIRRTVVGIGIAGMVINGCWFSELPLVVRPSFRNRNAFLLGGWEFSNHLPNANGIASQFRILDASLQ